MCCAIKAVLDSKGATAVMWWPIKIAHRKTTKTTSFACLIRPSGGFAMAAILMRMVAARETIRDCASACCLRSIYLIAFSFAFYLSNRAPRAPPCCTDFTLYWYYTALAAWGNAAQNLPPTFPPPYLMPMKARVRPPNPRLGVPGHAKQSPTPLRAKIVTAIPTRENYRYSTLI